jgi:hypothetical protein
MPQAKSDAVKAINSRDDYNRRVNLAVKDYKDQKLRPDGQRMTFRDVAGEHEVVWTTVRNRFNEIPSITDVNRERGTLNPAEEEVLVSHIEALGDMSMGLSHQGKYLIIISVASLILF